MIIRPYQPEDCKELVQLFYNTVHTINARDYTEPQLNAWADGAVDLKAWNRSLTEHTSLVAVEDGVIAGFADMDETGYLDRLYVHRDFQKMGIATALCDRLEASCPGPFTTHASITARPFFEKRGYRVVKEQQVERRGVFLTNFVMEKISKESPVRVAIAIDSLKGSLSSLEAGHAIGEGIRRVYSNARIDVRPLADGGEGTVEALVCGMGGRLETVTVTGPLGAPVDGQYGILPESRTAIIEMAEAAGITLVPDGQRNPLKTTTFGVGELIRDAIKKGCRRFLVGIGGSATNDGGAGMLQALGYGLLDASGKQIPSGARGLAQTASISAENVLPELSECTFRIACDVNNPLCGPEGASAVYGSQKGADAAMIQVMDQGLAHFASIARQWNPAADADFPGTGAAGGLGFAFLAFTNAVLESGIQIVLEETRLREYVKDADFVITGEGRLDGQTVMGKAPVGVARIAKEFGKPVLAFSGSVTREAAACNEAGIDAFFPILRSVVTLEEAMNPENARKNLADTAEQVFRLIRAVRPAAL